MDLKQDKAVLPNCSSQDRFIIENINSSLTNNYQKLKILGNGTFSQVFECLEINTGKLFAIKEVSKSFLLKHNLHDQFTKEIRIHFELEHPNIVKLIKVFENKSHMYLVLELGQNGTLLDLIERRKSLSELEIKFYLRGILQGLKFIHDKNILHRDLKPANLVLTEKMEIKIADFGLAAYAPKTKRKRKTFCGTPYFIAPEIITKEGHSFEVDYWSLGIVLYHMITGVCPFQSEIPEEVYKMILKGVYEANNYCSVELNEVITSLLQKEPQKRGNYQTLSESAFLSTTQIIKSLPISTLDTAPSESFIGSLKNCQVDQFGNVQKNVYAKSNSKGCLDFEDISNETEDYEYLKKWVNFSGKFGVGGIFNNGIICIFFNDKSKIVLSNFGISFHYIVDKFNQQNSIETFNILKYPKELEKKVRLLDYFIKFLRQNSHLVKINEKMPDNFVHITNFRITKYAALFLLSNKVYQTIFQDGTEVHIMRDFRKKKKVIYIDVNRTRTILEPGIIPENAIKKRLEHVNECLKVLNYKTEEDRS